MEEIGQSFDDKLKREPKVRKRAVHGLEVETVKTTDHNFNLPLFLLILLLTIGLFASWNWRRGGSVYANQQGYSAQSHQYNNYLNDFYQQQEHWRQQQVDQSNSRRTQFEEAAEAAAKKTWERTKWNSERITLLGILYNNNMTAQRTGRHDYIYLNEDWTINRLPNHLRLDADDRSFLRKFVRK